MLRRRSGRVLSPSFNFIIFYYTILLYRRLILLVQKYCHPSFLLVLSWCPFMAINVSVQYNGGLLPDIILLTLCNYVREPFQYHVEIFVPTANVPT